MREEGRGGRRGGEGRGEGLGGQTKNHLHEMQFYYSPQA